MKHLTPLLTFEAVAMSLYYFIIYLTPVDVYTCLHTVVNIPTNVHVRITFAGTGLILRHLRGGQEISPPVDQDLKYDFNFQQFRYIPPRKLLPVSLSYRN